MNALEISRAKFEQWLKTIKTKNRRAAYNRKRLAFLKANPVCAVCELPGTDTVHHKRGRKESALLDDTYFAAVHKKCDKWIHQNESEAKSRGLLLPFKK